ncbi:MAG: YraN family protein [Desulfurococcales archaeon]|nr:YraN family protein [Desulfurococcales archaeon]
MAGGRARKSSESIAATILEESGFRVIAFNKPVKISGVDVSEIDIVAEKDGKLYAVEVKAGMADVNAVRQAYVNALIAGMKPLIVARGIDEKARALASRLGVEYIILPDELLVTTDDLRLTVEDAVYSALLNIVSTLYWCGKLSKDETKIVEAIAEGRDLLEASERLGVDLKELSKALAELRRKGVLPKTHGYKALKAAAMVLNACIKGSVES